MGRKKPKRQRPTAQATGSTKDAGGRRVSEVAPNLFVGNKAAAQDADLLARLGVRGVVSVGAGGPPSWLGSDAAVFFKVGLKDNANDVRTDSWMREAARRVDAMLAAGTGAVLVHCMGGMSRSPAFVTAFLVLRRGMGLDEALRLVKERRPSVRISRPLMDALARIAGSQTTEATAPATTPTSASSGGAAPASAAASDVFEFHDSFHDSGSPGGARLALVTVPRSCKPDQTHSTVSTSFEHVDDDAVAVMEQEQDGLLLQLEESKPASDK